MRTASPAPTRPMPRWLLPLLGLLALAAIAIPLLVVATAPRVVPPAPLPMPARIVPATELPAVEPVALQPVAPTDARAINAAIPFSTAPNPAARPFRISGEGNSRARATDCLASAVYYEAGDDAVGQQAVAQVVLNRVRHPAYPNSVCGVVFQGAERSTGCQFTFTCDGSMQRYSPSPAAWERARDVARMALNGFVYAPVGHATHYHTDWVVPYWSASLEKITAVDTHLFFRWSGWWGTPTAFNRGYAGSEANVALMARLSPAHAGDPLLALDGLAEATMAIDPDAIPASAVPAATAADGNSFLVTLPKGMNADSFASLAIRTCGEKPYCKFMAWTDAARTPAALPLGSAQVATMAFSYLRDQTTGFAKALWNCEQFKRPSPVQCMRAQPLARAAATANAAPSPQPAVPALTGVRRKTSETAAPVSFTLQAPKAETLPKAAPKAAEN